MHRQLLGQALEVVGARHEVGLAVDLDQHADLAAHVDVVADDPFLGGAAGALGGRGHALLAQDLDRLVEVAAGLGQRRLAVHHPGSGLVAELLHHLCRDCHDLSIA